MIRELVRYDSEVISSAAKKFDFSNPPFDPIEFARDMVETMNAHGALGLAAPQIGVPYRILAIPATPNLVMFNPNIVDRSEETDSMEEGCLTYPGLIMKVERHKAIKVRFTQPNGEVVTEKYAGMAARAIQHEVDHLDGKTILNRWEGVKLYMAQKKWSKIVARTGGGPAKATRNAEVA